jgi:hypothetical protein
MIPGDSYWVGGLMDTISQGSVRCGSCKGVNVLAEDGK